MAVPLPSLPGRVLQKTLDVSRGGGAGGAERGRIAQGRGERAAPGRRPHNLAYTLDDVRERTDLVAVVSRYVSLRRAGRRLVGLCPFHQEKTPSFSVDPEKQLWHCFGCSEGGNVFQFLMKVENLPFAEAAERLAREAGIELESRRQGAQRTSEQDLLARINLEAAGFFRRSLQGEPGAAARAYLAERGLPQQVVDEFGLGYSLPAWDSLFSYLRSTGYPAGAIVRAGLCVPRPRGEGCYDRFRGRLMFPILDHDDRVVGFGGRLLPGADTANRQEAKYLNSPETPLFSKGKMLYGLNLARKEMARAGRAIIVEGYLDLITCHQFGFPETVATLGTALTEDHLRVLRRYTNRVYTAFDADSAGLAATLRSRELFEQAGLEARVLVMPAGHDPDTLLRAQGREALQQALAAAPDVVAYQLELIARGFTGESGSEARVAKEAVPVLASVRNAVARDAYVAHLADILAQGSGSRARALEQALREELRKAARAPRNLRRVAWAPAPESAPAPPKRGPVAERVVLAAMLQGEHWRASAAEKLGEQHFVHALHRELFRALVAGNGKADQVTGDPRFAALAADLGAQYGEIVDEDGTFTGAVERLEEARLRRRVQELDRQISAQRENETNADLLREYLNTRKLLSQLTGRRSTGHGGPAPV